MTRSSRVQGAASTRPLAPEQSRSASGRQCPIPKTRSGTPPRWRPSVRGAGERIRDLLESSFCIPPTGKSRVSETPTTRLRRKIGSYRLPTTSSAKCRPSPALPGKGIKGGARRGRKGGPARRHYADRSKPHIPASRGRGIDHGRFAYEIARKPCSLHLPQRPLVLRGGRKRRSRCLGGNLVPCLPGGHLDAAPRRQRLRAARRLVRFLRRPRAEKGCPEG